MMEMIKLNQRKRPLVGGRRWSSWLAALEGFTNEFERQVEVKIWIQQMQYRESQPAEWCPENSWLADEEIFTNVLERLAPLQIRIQDRGSKIYCIFLLDKNFFHLRSEKRAKLEIVSTSSTPTPPDEAQRKSTGGRAPRKQLATRVLHSFHEKARHVAVSPVKDNQSQASGLGYTP